MLTGESEQVFPGHCRLVTALAVCGPRLVSGSADRSVKVWAIGPAAPWACERTLAGPAGAAQTVALAVWRGKAAGGAADGHITVWDVATGARDAALAGHEGFVGALLVHRDRLLSASHDGTIRVWAAGTWAVFEPYSVRLRVRLLPA